MLMLRYLYVGGHWIDIVDNDGHCHDGSFQHDVIAINSTAWNRSNCTKAIKH